MNVEDIHTLLEKYWNCETTVTEEKILQDFFSQDKVPAELEEFIPLFRYKADFQAVKTSPDFEHNLEKAIHDQSKGNKYITIRIFAPALRIAASVALILSFAFGIYYLANQNRKAYFAETYNDPNAAMKHATFALDKLSDALKKGEQASMESIQELHGVDIDWAALDSLSTEREQHTDILTGTENL